MKYFLIIILFLSSNAFADKLDVDSYVHKLMNDSLEILNDTNISQSNKSLKISKMLAENMDTEWMGRFTLGRLIRTVSESQASAFLSTYKNYVITNYSKTLTLYKGEKVEVQDAQKMNEEFSIVKTQVYKSDGNVINVNYLVHKVDGNFKVCDVITEGISLINSQKAEYGSIIAGSGIEKLITELKAKTNQ